MLGDAQCCVHVHSCSLVLLLPVAEDLSVQGYLLKGNCLFYLSKLDEAVTAYNLVCTAVSCAFVTLFDVLYAGSEDWSERNCVKASTNCA